MKRVKTIYLVLALSPAGCMTFLPVAPPEGIVSRTPIEGTNYCLSRFPAIREDTLFSSHPKLKDPNDGDLVIFFGPCDYDPLGSEEINRQRKVARRERRTETR